MEAQSSDIGVPKRQLVAAAGQIATRLWESAVWEPTGGCWWPADHGASLRESVPNATHVDLYEGAAGVALFFAQLFAITGDARWRHIALASIKFSLRNQSFSNNSPSDLAVYAGPLGTAYAVEQINCYITSSESAQAETSCAVARLSAAPPNPRDCLLDLVSGAAGAVLVYLQSYRISKSTHLLNRAIDLGRELCARAHWSDEFCNWDAEDSSGFDNPALGGISHGAAGIALALLKLYEVTQIAELLMTARAALAYQTSLYRQSYGGWADLRVCSSGTDPTTIDTIGYGWCNGAAGIALVLNLAREIDTGFSEIYTIELSRAIAGIEAELRQSLAHPKWDLTLCHGVFGALESMNIVSELHPNISLMDFDRAYAALIDRYGPNWSSEAAWSTRKVGLMTGVSGVGHALLRRAHPDRIRPILIL